MARSLRGVLCYLPSPLPADLVITHALEWPSLTVQWLPVSSNSCSALLCSPARQPD